MFDLLIKNGLVVDGSGKPGFEGDVGIEGDRITLVGKADGAEAKEVIDAAGKVVCPGAIDPHSHADLTISQADHAKLLEPLVRQGITTFIGGNCGVGLAPLGEKNEESVRDYIGLFGHVDFERDVTWKNMGEYLDTLEKQGVVMNMAMLAPHGVIRLSEVGPERRQATAEELDSMARTVEQSLEGGAIGLSTGLQYFPGNHSDTAELLRLGEPLKAQGRIFTSHVRSYSKTLPRAIDEVLEVGRTHDVPVQISHLFWVPDAGPLGPLFRKGVRLLAKLSKYWVPPLALDKPLVERIDQMMKAKEDGVRVGCDVMPTTTAFTGLLAFFPPWALCGSFDEIYARFADKAVRAKMLRSIERGKMEWPHIDNDSWSLNFFKVMGWDSIHIMFVESEKNKRFEGMRLVDVAAEQGKHPLDAACDLIVEERGQVFVFMALAEPEDRLTECTTLGAIKHPEVSISTDTLLGLGKPSVLFYGCYPKFLGRYVRDMKLLDLEPAVRKITSLPAEHFGLVRRGMVREGYYADVVVFDFDKIASRATFDEPAQSPAGVEHVIINGHHVVDGDTFHPEPKPGAVLRQFS